MQTFKALVVEETSEGKYNAAVKDKLITDLPQGELLIKVLFSGLNYKDALSASGYKGITRRYPHTPGIDAAGVVVDSENSDFSPGDEVVVTGYDLGMNTSGGFAEYIRVPAKWAVQKPVNLSLKECMIVGTSGFTAASAVYEFIKHGIQPQSGKILVTGASGAVGSMAVAMLAGAGYRVIASSGKTGATTFLKELGAEEVIGRDEVDDLSERPLLPPRWIAALDTVGGNTLSTVIRSTAERGIVANCGMLASNKLDVSVFPFILRAIRLVGIASAETAMSRRLEIWNLISGKIKPSTFDKIHRIIPLHEVPGALRLMLNSSVSGKIVVEL
ncbi:MAG: YhdH/YhfP family quinone oxidoreductase [Bacteroidales bacterium]|nr:YhdH/YhfP family quinone oxidoreductase [Bacteroidales bacterium]